MGKLEEFKWGHKMRSITFVYVIYFYLLLNISSGDDLSRINDIIFSHNVNEEQFPPLVKPIAKFGNHKLRHTDYVRKLYFLPDGSLFSLSHNAAYIWDLNKGEKKFNFELETFMTGAVSRDGSTIVIAENGPHLSVFDAHTYNRIKELKGSQNRTSVVAISSNGGLIASTDKGTVILWDVKSGKKIRTWVKGGYIRGLDFSPDGKQLAISSPVGSVEIYNLDNKQNPIELNAGAKSTSWVAFSPTGKQSVNASENQGNDPCYTCVNFRVWDTDVKKVVSEKSGTYTGGAFSSDGVYFASFGLGKVRFYDTLNWSMIKELPKFNQYISSLAFSLDNKVLAIGVGNRIRLWDVDTFQEIKTGWGHLESVQSIELSPDEKSLATAGTDNCIIMWDFMNSKELCRIKTDHNYSVQKELKFSPDASALVVSTYHNFLAYDTNDRKSISLIGKFNGGGGVSFIAGGKMAVATERAGVIGVWNYKNNKLVQTIKGAQGLKKHFCSAVLTNSSTVWWADEYCREFGATNLSTGKEIFQNEARHGGTFILDPNGEWLTVGRNIYNAHTGKLISENCEWKGTVSSDGRFIIDSTKDQEIVIWEVLTKRVAYIQKTEIDKITDTSISAGSRFIAAAGSDHVRVWGIAPRLENSPELNHSEIEYLWDVLQGYDGWAAHKATWLLANGGESVLDFLENQYKQNIANSANLIKLLRKELIQSIRSLAVLERSGSDKALKILNFLSGKASGLIAQESKFILNRLKLRKQQSNVESVK